MLTSLTLCVVTSPLLSATFSGDWPQWRGPARDGVSRETQWSPEGKGELWRAQLGLGYSSVSVAGGRLYTLGYDKEEGHDVLWCLDAESGEEQWTHTWPAKIWNELHEGGTLTTPSVDGEHVYVLNREGRLLRLAAADGAVEWERDVSEEFKVKPPRWGFSASPLVLDDMVVLNLGVVVALDKDEGKTLWKTEVSYGDAYSTPVDLTVGGVACLAAIDSEGLAVLERRSGKELHFHPWRTKYGLNASTPVVVGERVFISSGMNHGGALLSLGEGELDVIWESKAIRTKLTGCVLIGEHLYGVDESGIKCLDLAGEERWNQRGLGDGCLIGAGDRLLALSASGELVVLAADPEKYEELARHQVLKGGKYWTTPVLCNGLVYCRNSKGELVCLDHRAAGEGAR